MEFFKYFFIFFLRTVEFFQKKIQLGTLNIQAMVKGYIWSESKVKDPNAILTMIGPMYFYFYGFLFFLMTVELIKNEESNLEPNIQAMIKRIVYIAIIKKVTNAILTMIEPIFLFNYHKSESP